MLKNENGHTIKRGCKLEPYRTINSKGNKTTKYRLYNNAKITIRTFPDRPTARRYMTTYGYQK